MRTFQTALLTLTGFVEWVSITHIMMDEGRLLRDLCLLLDQPRFQLGAAECLLQVKFKIYPSTEPYSKLDHRAIWISEFVCIVFEVDCLCIINHLA